MPHLTSEFDQCHLDMLKTGRQHPSKVLTKRMTSLDIFCSQQKKMQQWSCPSLQAHPKRLAFLWLSGNLLGDDAIQQLLPEVHGKVLSLNLSGTGTARPWEVVIKILEYSVHPLHWQHSSLWNLQLLPSVD